MLVGRLASMAWSGAVAILVIGLVVVTLLGLRIQVVESPSMSPTVPTGALALMDPASPEEVSGLGRGDVIAFQHPEVDELVLHRIVAVRSAEGEVRFETKGDANAEVDGRLVAPDEVHSTLARSVPGLGRILLWLRPPFGLVLLVGLPLLASVATRGPRSVGWSGRARNASSVT